MNTYFIEGGIAKSREEIWQSLRAALQDRFPQTEIDPALSLSYDRPDRFFLRGPQGIVSAKIFFEPLSHANVQGLRKEMDQWLHAFSGKKVFVFIFFPSCVDNLSRLIERLEGSPVFFEYTQLRSFSGPALVLNRKFYSQKAEKHLEALQKMTQPETYRFHQKARLTRDELQDLINLSLELKKIPVFQ